jgi:UMF1 family MFS transporter
LCGIYVLSPYIATVVIGDPVRGQEMLSRWHTISGLTVALTAPLLGASADRLGRRKPLLAGVLAILVVAMAAQYWAMPGEAGLPLWAVGAAVIVAGVTFTWTEVLHNSMLPTLAEPRLVPHVSGLGFALGNLSSLRPAPPKPSHRSWNTLSRPCRAQLYLCLHGRAPRRG